MTVENTPVSSAEIKRQWLMTAEEPRLYRDRADQLLKTMTDPRCACAATCPLHRIPGERWSRPQDVIRAPEVSETASDR